jgi:hypothetical protein
MGFNQRFPKQSAYLYGSPALREKMRAFSVDTFFLIA